MQMKMDMEMGLKVQEFIRLTVVLITSIENLIVMGQLLFLSFVCLN